MTKYEVKFTTTFKKDYKTAVRRHLKIELLNEIIAKLADGEVLPEKNHDHALSGTWDGFRECHVQPDWLLIYYVKDDTLVLTLSRTGTHNDLFGK